MSLAKNLKMMDPGSCERQAQIFTNTVFMWAGIYGTAANRLSLSLFSSQYTAFVFCVKPIDVRLIVHRIA